MIKVMYQYLHILDIFRRYSIVMMLCWVICCSIFAENVDLQKAEIVAQRFVESKQEVRTSADVRLKSTATGRREHHGRIHRATPQDEQEMIYYYVFDINENAGGGFVIVSGDDVVRPVLGYSTGGNYDENNLPPNFAYWMNYIQQEIAYSQSQDLPQRDDVKHEWEQYMSGTVKSTNVVGPLLQSRWNQGLGV